MTDESTERDLRLWAKDEAGQDVLCGLTVEDTEWYLEYNEKELAQRIGLSQPWASPQAFAEDRERWRELHRSHEHARAQRIQGDEQRKIDAEDAQGKNKRARRRY